MPELPDILAYQKAIGARTVGRRLQRVRLASPFLLRSVDPPLAEVEGRLVQGVRRIGKRLAIGLEGERFLVFHLMIAGRFHWNDGPPAKLGGKMNLAALDFERDGQAVGTLRLTEASPRKRASLHLVRGEAGLAPFDRGGVEVLEADVDEFETALRRENHTLKRALTDPRLFSGIGNAYSDEILHHARLSPAKLTSKLSSEEAHRLYHSTRQVLYEWIERLDPERTGRFPEKVTAFRPEMAVHGQYGQPCPACGAPVQHIVYADNECNYCASCQTGGRLLADRGLSRLLKSDWPRTLEELEESRIARLLPE